MTNKIMSGRVSRIEYIDILKGLAILLVVIGHAIQVNVPNIDINNIFLYIYSFHMPLLMFLSGFLAFGKNIDIKKKFNTLVVPFISWYVLQYLITYFSSNKSPSLLVYFEKLLISPDNGLWFLWILFLNFCLLKTIIYYTNIEAKYSELITLFIGWQIVKNIPTGILGIASVKWFFPFFGLGYLYHKYQIALNSKVIKVMLVLLFPVFAYYWQRNGIPHNWGAIQSFFIDHKLVGISYLLAVYKHVTPILGIGFCIAIVPMLNGYIGNLLKVLGILSMEIYVIHQYLLFGVGVGNWRVLSAACFAIIGSLALTTIMKKSSVLSYLFFGGRK